MAGFHSNLTDEPTWRTTKVNRDLMVDARGFNAWYDSSHVLLGLDGQEAPTLWSVHSTPGTATPAWRANGLRACRSLTSCSQIFVRCPTTMRSQRRAAEDRINGNCSKQKRGRSTSIAGSGLEECLQLFRFQFLGLTTPYNNAVVVQEHRVRHAPNMH